MPWTQQTATVEVNGTNPTIGVTAGDLIVVALIDGVQNSTATIGDGGVNSYLQLNANVDAGASDNTTIITRYAIAVSTTTLTLQPSGAAAGYLISAATFRNTGTLTRNASNGQYNSTGSSATDGDKSGAYACTAGDLQIGWIVDTSAIPAANWAAAGTGFTRLAGATQQDGTNPALAFEYLLNSAGGSQQSTWTAGTTDRNLVVGGSFTATQAGAPSLMGSSIWMTA